MEREEGVKERRRGEMGGGEDRRRSEKGGKGKGKRERERELDIKVNNIVVEELQGFQTGQIRF